MHNNFFGSKLNTALLFILIILMVAAIHIMLQNKSTYLPFVAPHEAPLVQQFPGFPDQVIGDESIDIPKSPIGVTLESAVIAKIKSQDNGPLEKCTMDGQAYFLARGSVFDGSDNIYDSKGNLSASCGGGWGYRPDPYPPLCTEIYNPGVCATLD